MITLVPGSRPGLSCRSQIMPVAMPTTKSDFSNKET